MNEKPISCGFLILNSKNEILACHPTGAAFEQNVELESFKAHEAVTGSYFVPNGD